MQCAPWGRLSLHLRHVLNSKTEQTRRCCSCRLSCGRRQTSHQIFSDGPGVWRQPGPTSDGNLIERQGTQQKSRLNTLDGLWTWHVLNMSCCSVTWTNVFKVTHCRPQRPEWTDFWPVRPEAAPCMSPHLLETAGQTESPPDLRPCWTWSGGATQDRGFLISWRLISFREEAGFYPSCIRVKAGSSSEWVASLLQGQHLPSSAPGAPCLSAQPQSELLLPHSYIIICNAFQPTTLWCDPM